MDNIDEAEGPRVRIVNNNNEIRLLYTSLIGMVTPFDLVSLAFAIFLVIFGLIGYIEAGSVISLIASAGISIPIFISSYLTTRHMYWSLLALAAALLLFIMMSIRFYKSGKLYPAGVVACVTFVYITFLTTRLALFYRDSNRQSTGQ